jgi:hypothetical protein
MASGDNVVTTGPQSDKASAERRPPVDPDLSSSLVERLRNAGLLAVVKQFAHGYYEVAEGSEQPLTEAVLNFALGRLDEAHFQLSGQYGRECEARDAAETRLQHSELLVKMLLNQGTSGSTGTKRPRDV